LPFDLVELFLLAALFPGRALPPRDWAAPFRDDCAAPFFDPLADAFFAVPEVFFDDFLLAFFAGICFSLFCKRASYALEFQRIYSRD
jgi:hypothetical protein